MRLARDHSCTKFLPAKGDAERRKRKREPLVIPLSEETFDAIMKLGRTPSPQSFSRKPTARAKSHFNPSIRPHKSYEIDDDPRAPQPDISDDDLIMGFDDE